MLTIVNAYGFRPIWERFVELELCLSKGGGSLMRVQAVEARMQQVRLYRFVVVLK